jgi:hypothetical protein
MRRRTERWIVQLASLGQCDNCGACAIDPYISFAVSGSRTILERNRIVEVDSTEKLKPMSQEIANRYFIAASIRSLAKIYRHREKLSRIHGMN